MADTCADKASKQWDGSWRVEVTCPYCETVNYSDQANYYGFSLECSGCQREFEVVDYED